MATVFDTQSASTAHIVSAGENALLYLYNGKPGERLESLWHALVRRWLLALPVQPQSLHLVKYHSLHVYNQVQQWKGQRERCWVCPCPNWLTTSTHELLQVIRCTCKTDCSSLRCTCKKHDVECSVACSNCKGSECANSSQAACDDNLRWWWPGMFMFNLKVNKLKFMFIGARIYCWWLVPIWQLWIFWK